MPSPTRWCFATERGHAGFHPSQRESAKVMIDSFNEPRPRVLCTIVTDVSDFEEASPLRLSLILSRVTALIGKELYAGGCMFERNFARLLVVAAAVGVISRTSSGQVITSPRAQAQQETVFAVAASAPIQQPIFVSPGMHDTYAGIASLRQGVSPRVTQRGVQIDGTKRSAPGFDWGVHANPAPNEPVSFERFGADIDPFHGSYSPLEIDLRLPSRGVAWAVGRTYNALQTAGRSDGPQGVNWMQTSQPEIQVAGSRVYLVYGADRFLEFEQTAGAIIVDEAPTNPGVTLSRIAGDVASGSSQTITPIEIGGGPLTYRGVNGAAGAVYATTVAVHDMLVYVDAYGVSTWFFSPLDADNAAAAGQLWRMVDPAGNSTFVGHATSPTLAISTGFTPEGLISTAFDASGRRYDYTYATVAGHSRLVSVAVHDQLAGVWTPTGDRVDYAYYGEGSPHGLPGDLSDVTVQVPASSFNHATSPQSVVWMKTHYRYWITDQSGGLGADHQVRLVVGPEGTRRFDLDDDGVLNNSFRFATSDALKAYSDALFEYATSGPDAGRITAASFGGDCGCSGQIDGRFTFAYETNPAFVPASGYQNTPFRKVTITRPALNGTLCDAIPNYRSLFFDEAGQPLSEVISQFANGAWQHFVDAVERSPYDAATRLGGLVTRKTKPSAVSNTLADTWQPQYNAAAGLIWTFVREQSDVPTRGMVEAVRWQVGETGGATSITTWNHTAAIGTAGAVRIARPLVSSERKFETATLSHETSHLYTFHAAPATLVVRSHETRHPAVSAAKNGSGVRSSTFAYYRRDRTPAFERNEVGTFTYRLYSDGVESKLVEDVQTGSTTDIAVADDPATVFGIAETMPADALRRVTVTDLDRSGRPVQRTLANGRVERIRYVALADGTIASLMAPRFDSATGLHHGPVAVRVLNPNGDAVAEAMIGFAGGTTSAAMDTWVNTDTTDIVEALTTPAASLKSLTLFERSPSGGPVRSEQRFKTIPASLAAALPSDSESNYFYFDGLGNQIIERKPDGTVITRCFDARGLKLAEFSGYETPGGRAAPSARASNSTGGIYYPPYSEPTEETEYDQDGNPTNPACIIVGTSGSVPVARNQNSDRDAWVQVFDPRGNVVARNRAASPHYQFAYDNLGRVREVATYSTPRPLQASQLGAPSTIAQNRLSLTTIDYDERGMRFRIVRHNIDAATGQSVATVPMTFAYDAAGRVVKHVGDEVVKLRYDRLGRELGQSVLAAAFDTTYADFLTTSTDVVLEEERQILDLATDQVLAVARIARLHADAGGSETRGPLDTNADANLNVFSAGDLRGRAQFIRHWYDALDRRIASVAYGTNGGSTFAPLTLALPSASTSDALLTQIRYEPADGRVQAIIQPSGREDRFAWDALNQLVAYTENFAPVTTGPDQNRKKFWSYVGGQVVEFRAEDPQSAPQITSYGYAPIGSPDRMLSGSALRWVTYPDGSTEWFYRNRNGSLAASYDRAFNWIEHEYDQAARLSRSTIYPNFGFDPLVTHQEYGYDSRGNVNSIAQLSGATVLNHVTRAYDGLGNLLEQSTDVNSLVTAGGDHFTTSWQYAAPPTIAGAETPRGYRRLGVTYPSGATVSYSYNPAAGSAAYHNASGHVSGVGLNSSDIASYTYFGSSRLASVTYPKIDVWTAAFDSSGHYNRLDRFNRQVHTAWNRIGAPAPFVDVLEKLDANGNPVSHRDSTHRETFDLAHLYDELDRLVQTVRGDLKEGDEGAFESVSASERRTLDHNGNWTTFDLDPAGLFEFNATGAFQSSATHGSMNELQSRNIDTNADGVADVIVSQAHDQLGNLVDDGERYRFTYDPMGRVVAVNDRDTGLDIARYEYDGLGQRIGELIDENQDGKLSDDSWRRIVYDDASRRIETYVEPAGGGSRLLEERFVYHAAGLRGLRSSTVPDAVAVRQRDLDGNGELDQLHYYCQNYRGDMLAVLDSDGAQVEQVRYSGFGRPFLIPAGDLTSDGAVLNGGAGSDVHVLSSLIATSTYDVRADINLDGQVNSMDLARLMLLVGAPGGDGRVSNHGHTFGFGAMRAVPGVTGWFDARARWYNPMLGRWNRTDPLGYIDGSNLYEYVRSNPLSFIDPFGLVCAEPPDRLWRCGQCMPCREMDPNDPLRTTDPCVRNPNATCRWGDYHQLHDPEAWKRNTDLMIKLAEAYIKGLGKLGKGPAGVAKDVLKRLLKILYDLLMDSELGEAIKEKIRELIKQIEDKLKELEGPSDGGGGGGGGGTPCDKDKDDGGGGSSAPLIVLVVAGLALSERRRPIAATRTDAIKSV